MEEEKNENRFKLMNILWQHIKQTIIISIILIKKSQLQFDNIDNICIYLIVFSFGLNLIAIIFFYFVRKGLLRKEYFIYYVINLTAALIQIICLITVYYVIYIYDPIQSLFLKAYIFVIVQKEFEILIITLFSFEIANRQVNSCSSICIVFLICSSHDSVSCMDTVLLLLIILVNSLSHIFYTVFHMLLYKYNQIKSELKNFLKQLFNKYIISLISLMIVLSYLILFFNLIQNKINSDCHQTNFIIECYKQIIIVNIFSIIPVIIQEIYYYHHQIKEELIQPQNNQSQNQLFIHINYNKKVQFVNNKQINSYISTQLQKIEINKQLQENQIRASARFSQSEDKQNNFEKLGTSQFGASMHQSDMVHSWANVQHDNPFIYQTESHLANTIVHQATEKRSKSNAIASIDDAISRDDSFHVANPMESGSQLMFQ